MYASQVVNSGLWVASIPSFRNCLPISNTRSSPPTTRVFRKISVAIRSDKSWPSAFDLHVGLSGSQVISVMQDSRAHSVRVECAKARAGNIASTGRVN